MGKIDSKLKMKTKEVLEFNSNSKNIKIKFEIDARHSLLENQFVDILSFNMTITTSCSI